MQVVVVLVVAGAAERRGAGAMAELVQRVQIPPLGGGWLLRPLQHVAVPAFRRSAVRRSLATARSSGCDCGFDRDLLWWLRVVFALFLGFFGISCFFGDLFVKC